MEATPYLTVEEMLEVFDGMDKFPIYHMGPNNRDVRFICNCCSCCCDVYGAMSGLGILEDKLSPTRFLCTTDTKKCTGCEACVTQCPFHAIEMLNDKAHISGTCFGCGTCVINCPDEALKLKIVRPPEHVPETGPQVVELGILEVGDSPDPGEAHKPQS